VEYDTGLLAAAPSVTMHLVVAVGVVPYANLVPFAVSENAEQHGAAGERTSFGLELDEDLDAGGNVDLKVGRHRREG